MSKRTEFLKENQKEVDKYKGWLKQIFDNEYSITCCIKKVSKNGTTRQMKFVANYVKNGKLITNDITYWISKVLNCKLTSRGELIVSGCGMDMVFHIIYSLSDVLYDDGYKINYGKVWKI